MKETSAETGAAGERRIRALLVGLRDETMSASEAQSLSRELEDLTRTLEVEIAGTEIVRVRGRQPRFGVGTGKAAEIAEKAAAVKADCVIFDRDLGPSQERNWEELAGIPVIDRQGLIIQIFAHRAHTREAALEVSLAELTYALPRLRHKYIDLSQQRGGRYGTRGSGETRLETDRRRLEQRIDRLKDELEKVKRHRGVQRKLRERRGMNVCAFAGYTNTGKSSLLNALTGAGVFAEDKLFATLGSTSRRLGFAGGRTVLLVDTVGFIRRLPHGLVNAFRSTLEEVSLADLILIVLDAGSPDTVMQYDTTLAVLRELDASEIPAIVVINKIDLVAAKEERDALLKAYPAGVAVSALTGEGLAELRIRIENALFEEAADVNEHFDASETSGEA